MFETTMCNLAIDLVLISIMAAFTIGLGVGAAWLEGWLRKKGKKQ